MKLCSNCKQSKPLDVFARNKSRLDGYEYWCKECNNLRHRRDYCKESKSEYYKVNREKILSERKKIKRSPEYYKAHYQKYKYAIDRWVNNHRHIVNAMAAKRRACLKNATPVWADLKKIGGIYEKAAIYNAVFPEKGPWEVDHIYPLQSKKLCGFHVEWNLQLLPASVNRRKNNKVPI